MRKIGNGVWTTILPKQGVWYHVTDIAKVGDIYLKLNELCHVTRIEVVSICLGDARKWVLNTQDKVLRFHTYLLSKVGHDDLKIRVRSKRHYRREKV